MRAYDEVQAGDVVHVLTSRGEILAEVGRVARAADGLHVGLLERGRLLWVAPGDFAIVWAGKSHRTYATK